MEGSGLLNCVSVSLERGVALELEVLEVKATSAFENHRVTSLKIEILNYTGVSIAKSKGFRSQKVSFNF